MSYNIINLKARLAGILHGTTLNQITNFEGLVYSAASQFLLDLDPQETKRIAELVNPIYNSVYDYAVPDDLKGNKIIDIRPQVNRTNVDFFPQRYGRDFDIFKWLTQGFTIQHNSGIKTVRISDPNLPVGITLNMVNSITGEGTWTVGGDASNLEEDQIYYAAGNSSLKFQLNAAGSSGYLENSTMSKVDLTSHYNQGKIFLYVYLPDASNFTSIALRFGSDSANYYQKTVTADFNGNSFVDGWNLLAFDWDSATKVLSPDYTKIGYLRIDFAYNGTLMTGVRLDNIVSRLGSILEVVYYSKFIFKDVTTGAWQETITDDSNIINLDTESYNIFEALVAIYCAQQQQGVSALQFDFTFWKNLYNEGLKNYQGMYKSEVQKPQSTYYKKSSSSYNKFANYRPQR